MWTNTSIWRIGRAIQRAKDAERRAEEKAKEKQDNYTETYDYFMTLTLAEQHQYIKENYYLSEYSYEFLYNNKEDTAHNVAKRAEYMNTTFNDKVIKYKKY